MTPYEETKKTRRVAAVIYVLIMAVLVGGSYLSQQNKVTDQEEDVTIIYDAPLFKSQAQDRPKTHELK